MNTFCRISGYIRAFFYVAVLVGFAGCGGGGGGGGGDGSPLAGRVNSDPIRAIGRIVDPQSQPVADAQVIMPFGDNRVWGGTSNASGDVNFELQPNDFRGIDPVVMIVSKDGFKPKTLFFPPVSPDRNLDIGTVVLEGLAPNEFVPAQSIGLWHLGDGRHSGTANARLQSGLFGPSITFEVTDWDQAKENNFGTATVEFVGRGLQSTGSDGTVVCTAGYDNRVRVFSVLNDVVQGESSQNPGNSDVSGDFSRFQINLSAEQFPVGSRVFVGFTSGACLDQNVVDLDDFEVTEILVRFTP